jgi:hypothetical protein
MSVIGGIGMLSQAFMNPQIGKWLDNAKEAQEALGKTGVELELAAGQEVLGTLTLFPLVLIVAFTVLFFWQKRSKSVSL